MCSSSICVVRIYCLLIICRWSSVVLVSSFDFVLYLIQRDFHWRIWYKTFWCTIIDSVMPTKFYFRAQLNCYWKYSMGEVIQRLVETSKKCQLFCLSSWKRGVTVCDEIGLWLPTNPPPFLTNFTFPWWSLAHLKRNARGKPGVVVSCNLCCVSEDHAQSMQYLWCTCCWRYLLPRRESSLYYTER